MNNSEWISIEDRLPEEDMEVIGYDIEEYWILSFNKEQGVFYDDREGWRIYISHWMPLPEPPEDNND